MCDRDVRSTPLNRQGSLMKLISQTMFLVLSALLVVGLTGCAAPLQKADAHVHTSTETTDMQAMCEMHGKMMRGKPIAEQQSMMQENVKSVTPEMRQRMLAMHEKCK
jgi:hypothetical protein